MTFYFHCFEENGACRLKRWRGHMLEIFTSLVVQIHPVVVASASSCSTCVLNRSVTACHTADPDTTLVCDGLDSMVATSEFHIPAHHPHPALNLTFYRNIIVGYRTAVKCGNRNLFGTVLQNSKHVFLRKSMYDGTDIELKGRIFQHFS